MEQEIIILSADAYDMPLENGTRRQGTSITYINGFEPICNSTGQSYGYKPIKESLPYEFINEIAQAGGCPINAVATFILRPVGGKQVLKISQCRLIPNKK